MSPIVAKALALDGEERPVEAAAAYESAIMAGDASLDCLLNLAVLYLAFLDFGFAAHHRVPREEEEKAGARFHEVLEEAQRRFGSNNEVAFWRYFFGYMLLGEQANPEKVLALAEQGPSSIPYFHLFLLPGGKRFAQQAKSLFEEVRAGRTERERYVRGFLQGKV